VPDMWNVCVRGFGGRKPEGGEREREREREHLQYLGVGERIILNWI
jgi:hypothetical protein